MSNKILDKFFRENNTASKLPTACAIANFSISVELNEEKSDVVHGLINKYVLEDNQKRKVESAANIELIDALDSSEQVIKMMRMHIDPINTSEFLKKALVFEKELIPQVVKLFKTSLNAKFIEISVRILAKSQINTSDEIISYFDDIRSPYAQSMALVFLGFKADEKYIPWFIEKYKELKKKYPNEDYHEGAYYGLYEMDNRFYR